MYVILVNEDNTLCTTNRERIMQRSKLFDSLWFLVYPTYKGYDMGACTALLEYRLPVSKRYRSEILTLSAEKYKDYLKYVLPFDTTLTAEPGEIEIQLSFIYSDLDPNGKSIQRVRKIEATTISILPISAWSDVIPDCALNAIDQRIIKIDAQLKAINDISNATYVNKADDISYNENTNELQLMSGSTPIGGKVVLKNCDLGEDGIPVVDFNSSNNDEFISDEENNIVVF